MTPPPRWVEQRVTPAEGKHQTVLLYKGSESSFTKDQSPPLQRIRVLLYKESELYLQSQKTVGSYTKAMFGLNLRVWLVSTWNGINRLFSQNFKLTNFFYWFYVCMLSYTVKILPTGNKRIHESNLFCSEANIFSLIVQIVLTVFSYIVSVVLTKILHLFSNYKRLIFYKLIHVCTLSKQISYVLSFLRSYYTSKN